MKRQMFVDSLHRLSGDNLERASQWGVSLGQREERTLQRVCIERTLNARRSRDVISRVCRIHPVQEPQRLLPVCQRVRSTRPDWSNEWLSGVIHLRAELSGNFEETWTFEQTRHRPFHVEVRFDRVRHLDSRQWIDTVARERRVYVDALWIDAEFCSQVRP